MSYMNSTAKAIQEMVRFFLPLCSEQSTLRELEEMVADEKKWRFAHALFRKMRGKNLQAIDARDKLLQHQYCFEETCAKTVYNSSGAWHIKDNEFPYPFDQDSPFWVFPIAVDFARALGVADPLSISSHLGPRSAD